MAGRFTPVQLKNVTACSRILFGRRDDMVASFLVPLLFTLKMGGLLVFLRGQIRTLERARRERAEG